MIVVGYANRWKIIMNAVVTPQKRLYQKIGQGLKDRIVSGEFVVGDRLPPEREIAVQCQVSRSVVREALIMLELQDVVEVRKGSGVYIINQPKEDIDAKTGTSESDDAGPFEMLQARQLLESHIAEFAATQVTRNDIFRLRKALQMERQQIEGASFDYDGDKMFHMAIAEATQNKVLVDMVEDLWVRRQNSSMWLQLHARIVNQNYRKAWLEDHEKILLALQHRDASAARDAMWQHLENVKQTLLELSDVDDPLFDGFLFSNNPVVSLA
ncbi:transcriptional regulator, GntR family [Psychromonas ingrahamii 37]|uniref:Transcriptional regulator, GntR family n=2 Tax=Psychromonas ingrahamii TaxID=357794 RepID=A1SR94_PSYIN|nr:transcriptional regulator, GntR family [Psychromonas ingrahamii 37]